MAWPKYKASFAIAAGQKSGSPGSVPLAIGSAVGSELSAMLDADGSTPAQNGGGDIRAYADAALTTQVPLHVKKLTTDNNPANGSALLYVNFGSLSSDACWLAWGSDEGTKSQPAANDTYGQYAVYPSGWLQWDMEENPAGSAPQILDSSSNACHLTSAGSMTLSDLVDAKVGKGLDFDGSDDQLAIASTATLKPALPITFDFWCIPPSTERSVFDTGEPGAYAGVHIRVSRSSSFVSFNDGGAQASTHRRSKSSAFSTTPGALVHFHVVLRGAADMSVLVNDSDVGGSYSGSGGPLAYGTSDVVFGYGQYFGSSRYAGVIDTMMLFAGEQTSASRTTRYNNTNNNAAFWDVGNVQNVSSIARYPIIMSSHILG